MLPYRFLQIGLCQSLSECGPEYVSRFTAEAACAPVCVKERQRFIAPEELNYRREVDGVILLSAPHILESYTVGPTNG